MPKVEEKFLLLGVFERDGGGDEEMEMTCRDEMISPK